MLLVLLVPQADAFESFALVVPLDVVPVLAEQLPLVDGVVVEVAVVVVVVVEAASRSSIVFVLAYKNR